jgi:hypothetical protein
MGLRKFKTLYCKLRSANGYNAYNCNESLQQTRIYARDRFVAIVPGMLSDVCMKLDP